MPASIIANILPTYNLKDYYDNFLADNKGDGNKGYTPTHPGKFSIWIFSSDFNLLALKTLAPFLGSGVSATKLASLAFLSSLIDSVGLPEISTQDGDYPVAADKGVSDFGYLSYPGKFMVPETNEFSISFLDTEVSPIDSFFFQWLSQTTSSEWIYPDRPYMVANIFISPTGSSSLIKDVTLPRQIYCMFRCFPSKIQPTKFDIGSEPGVSRNVTFKFSKFIIIPNIIGMVESLAAALPF